MDVKFLFDKAQLIVAAALAIALASAVMYAYSRRHAGASGRDSRVVAGLKLMRLAALAVLLMNAVAPVFSYDIVEREKGRVAFVLDSSASMGFSNGADSFGRNGASRYEAVLEAERSARLFERIATSNALNFFAFSSGLRPLAGHADYRKTAPAGATDMAGALSELSNLSGLSAIVLVSDGRSTSEMAPSQMARFLGTPVYAVGAGNPADLRDIALADVSYPRVCYNNERTDINFDLVQSGFSGAGAVVTLYEDRVAVKQVPVPLDRDRMPLRVTFEPKKSGLVRYELAASPMSGEVTLANNTHPFYMNVTDHRVRVLHVESYPRQEFAVFQRLMASNRDVSYSFRFLRAGAPEYAFKPSDASKFDVLVLGNIDFTKLPADIDSALDAAVSKNNAAVLFMGGPSFAIGAGGALSKRFPLGQAGPYIYEEARYKPQLTAEGNNHLVTRISPVAKINSYMWNDIPELCGVSYTADQSVVARQSVNKNAAEILLAANIQSKAAQRAIGVPIVAVRGVLGKKSAAILGNSTWFMKFGQISSKNAMLYDRLMANLIIWLYSREDSTPFKVETDRTNYFSDDAVSVAVTARNSDYMPMADPSFAVRLTDSNGREHPVASKPSMVEPGYYEFSFKTAVPGEYELTVEAAPSNGRKQSAKAKYITVNSSREFSRLDCDHEAMREIAAASGGRFYDLSTLSALPQELPAMGAEKRSRVEFATIESGALMAFLITILAAEWAIRRFSGYE